jgi:hypothetical protein
MFFLERYMKKFNNYVQQMGKPKGSIVEGYILCESSYDSNEYIKKIHDTLGIVVWEDELDEDKGEGEILKMNIKRCIIKNKPTIFCKVICIDKLLTLKLLICI